MSIIFNPETSLLQLSLWFVSKALALTGRRFMGSGTCWRSFDWAAGLMRGQHSLFSLCIRLEKFRGAILARAYFLLSPLHFSDSARWTEQLTKVSGGLTEPQ